MTTRLLWLPCLLVLSLFLAGCEQAADEQVPADEPAAEAEDDAAEPAAEEEPAADETAATEDTAELPATGAPGTERKTESGLKITDIKVGDGATAEPGKTVTVHYTGTLVDGTVFDSSKRRDEPFSFRLGAGEVIPGWDEGVQGMKVGGQRKLVIPPELGYGAMGSPPVIPPNAVLNFEIELLDVK